MSAVEIGQSLPDSIRALTLLRADGESVSLASLIAKPAMVLVFLRHFGCLACREHVGLWKPHLAKFVELGVRVHFVGNGDVAHLREFIDKAGLTDASADVLTDPEQRVYAALGLENSVASVLSPGAMFNALRAVARGNIQTSVEGDPTQQGGVLIVDADGQVVLLHREARLGDYLPVEDALASVPLDR
ncbi:peroxiredoxin-like family protein [Cerasicoccus maritimus]|uniref:peroxiredoxin-like family protein n=1 Tax=Cerasicoccus maritimus TaxID=490089 RepID=UPI00285288F8|nr:peroxiredoxin-like family protein [Cerasicoccus maritimus]